MTFRSLHKLSARSALAGFTLVEAVISIGLLGVGVAITVGNLTKMNQIASASRYRTAAYTALMSQISLFQSVGPFNPQNIPPLIPEIPWAADGTYDLRIGTHKPIYYKDPSTGVVSPTWPIYRESDSNVALYIPGTMTTTVTDISPVTPPNIPPKILYNAVVTITYTYLGRDYQFAMSAIRTSDK